MRGRPFSLVDCLWVSGSVLSRMVHLDITRGGKQKNGLRSDVL